MSEGVSIDQRRSGAAAGDANNGEDIRKEGTSTGSAHKHKKKTNCAKRSDNQKGYFKHWWGGEEQPT
jgi:hypothetical protein